MVVIESDALNSGWGACSNNLAMGGQWSTSETLLHINAKEVLAAFLALKTFARRRMGIHIRLKIHNSTAVYFVNRRDSNGHHLTDVGLVRGEKDLHLSQTTTRQDEYHSRPRVESETRQLGVEAQPFSVPAADAEIRSMPNRPVCFKTHDTAPRIFQLEARPQLCGDQRSGLELVRSKMLCFPPFALIGRCLANVSREEVPELMLIAPVWPTKPWFPLIISMRIQQPILLTNTPARSKERDTPSHTSGLTKYGRMGCVRSSLQSQGVSDEASELILASWRQNTESAYFSNWGRWSHWRQQNGHNQLSAPIGPRGDHYSVVIHVYILLFVYYII